jgi:hypothetical protein
LAQAAVVATSTERVSWLVPLADGRAVAASTLAVVMPATLPVHAAASVSSAPRQRTESERASDHIN